MNWKDFDWGYPYTWLLQEGCPTYFSSKVVTTEPSVYFSYDDLGEPWLDFAQSNRQKIFQAFQLDLQVQSPQEIFQEWFSINGGARFGHSRLAYYIGHTLLLHLIDHFGELEAVTSWKRQDFYSLMEHALKEVTDGA